MDGEKPGKVIYLSQLESQAKEKLKITEQIHSNLPKGSDTTGRGSKKIGEHQQTQQKATQTAPAKQNVIIPSSPLEPALILATSVAVANKSCKACNTSIKESEEKKDKEKQSLLDQFKNLFSEQNIYNLQ